MWLGEGGKEEEKVEKQARTVEGGTKDWPQRSCSLASWISQISQIRQPECDENSFLEKLVWMSDHKRNFLFRFCLLLLWIFFLKDAYRKLNEGTLYLEGGFLLSRKEGLLLDRQEHFLLQKSPRALPIEFHVKNVPRHVSLNPKLVHRFL